MLYVLDTHPIVWYLESSPRLSAKAKNLMEEPTSEFIVPTIVMLEIRSLHSKNRIKTDLAKVQKDFIQAKNCEVYPLDEEVVLLSPNSLNIHDSIIVGTALVYRDIYKQTVSLITKDGEITKSGIIQTLW